MAYEISSEAPVLFYDGNCPLCNRVVRFILDQEHAPVLYFSAQQHQATMDWLAQHPAYAMNEDTVYYFNGKKLYVRSTAVLRLIPTLKWYWGFLYVGWFVPKMMRDALYDFVAKQRKKFGGECLIDPRLKGRVLKS
jgi:predicted DCC family thiol-disulfide oxidoreductase YuxK